MYIDASAKIFLGCRVSGKLKMALEHAKEEDRAYFDHPDSPYLRIIDMGEEQWIGRVVEPGIKVGEAEDLRNNVISILRRVAPDVRHQSSNVKIFAALESVIQPQEDPSPVVGEAPRPQEDPPYFG